MSTQSSRTVVSKWWEKTCHELNIYVEKCFTTTSRVPENFCCVMVSGIEPIRRKLDGWIWENKMGKGGVGWASTVHWWGGVGRGHWWLFLSLLGWINCRLLVMILHHHYSEFSLHHKTISAKFKAAIFNFKRKLHVFSNSIFPIISWYYFPNGYTTAK